MKLKSVKLHPFAGVQDKSVEFDSGLNLISGPNEAGKSTVFHAIQNGLLTTTYFTDKQLNDVMGRFFPVSGGDTIRVTLEIEFSEGEVTRIEKVWRKGNRKGSSTLHLPDGTEITDEEVVQQRIETLLPVSPGTVKTILLTNQASLHQTINEMQERGEVRKELGDVLRQNLMETGGVSIDRFKDLLDQRYDDYFKRWDREQNYPENNRGISNPYKTGNGKVLDAFYRKEHLRLDLEYTRQFENELDRLNSKLSDLGEQKYSIKTRFDELQPLKKGISRRQVLGHSLEAAREKRTRLLEISQQWPVLEDRLKQLNPKQEELSKKLETLNKELARADNKQQAEQLQAKLKKAGEFKISLEQTEKELMEAQIIEESDLKQLRDLLSEIRSLKATIEGARLTLKMVSESEKNIRFRESGKGEETFTLKPDKIYEKTAGGGFRLIIEGVTVDVFSGDGELEDTLNKVMEKESELTLTFENLNVTLIQDAESLAELFRQKKLAFENAKRYLDAELDGADISELEQQLAAFGDLSGVRGRKEINDDLIEVGTELIVLTDKAAKANEKLEAWKNQYESSENVMLELADFTKSIKDFSIEFESLPELPKGFESADAFIEETERLQQEIQNLDDRIYELKLEKTGKEAGSPETSSEEFEKMLLEAESDFERIQREAETLANVRERALSLLQDLDSDTYSSLKKSFIKWLGLMAGERFTTVELDHDLPNHFNTDDGRSLSFELLSHGTKDTVSLAWRFALLEHFMKDQSGLIILDDPMVDMDPDRRALASKAIGKFAEKQQVLLMTCHPELQKMFSNTNVLAIME